MLIPPSNGPSGSRSQSRTPSCDHNASQNANSDLYQGAISPLNQNIYQNVNQSLISSSDFNLNPIYDHDVGSNARLINMQSRFTSESSSWNTRPRSQMPPSSYQFIPESSNRIVNSMNQLPPNTSQSRSESSSQNMSLVSQRPQTPQNQNTSSINTSPTSPYQFMTGGFQANDPRQQNYYMTSRNIYLATHIILTARKLSKWSTWSVTRDSLLSFGTVFSNMMFHSERVRTTGIIRLQDLIPDPNEFIFTEVVNYFVAWLQYDHSEVPLWNTRPRHPDERGLGSYLWDGFGGQTRSLFLFAVRILHFGVQIENNAFQNHGMKLVYFATCPCMIRFWDTSMLHSRAVSWQERPLLAVMLDPVQEIGNALAGVPTGHILYRLMSKLLADVITDEVVFRHFQEGRQCNLWVRMIPLYSQFPLLQELVNQRTNVRVNGLTGGGFNHWEEYMYRCNQGTFWDHDKSYLYCLCQMPYPAPPPQNPN